MSADVTEQKKALREAALHFHQFPKPGKLEIQATKPLGNQRDLSLAYSPGVAAPCEEIAADPEAVTKYTSRGNLVAVISNGTAEPPAPARTPSKPGSPATTSPPTSRT